MTEKEKIVQLEKEIELLELENDYLSNRVYYWKDKYERCREKLYGFDLNRVLPKIHD